MLEKAEKQLKTVVITCWYMLLLKNYVASVFCPTHEGKAPRFLYFYIYLLCVMLDVNFDRIVCPKYVRECFTHITVLHFGIMNSAFLSLCYLIEFQAAYTFFYQKQAYWLQPGCFLIFVKSN